MTEAYHKARRYFGFASALLLAWAFVGLKPAEESIDLAFSSAEVVFTIDHPEAFPIVILVLVFFFCARFTIEWLQCDSEKRSSLATKSDLCLAYGVGLSAVLVFAFQETYDLAFAEVFTPKAAAMFSCGAVFSVLCLFGALLLFKFRRDRFIVAILIAVILSIIPVFIMDSSITYVLAWSAGSVFGIFGALFYAHRKTKV